MTDDQRDQRHRVTGWRVFGLGDNGELLPPFPPRYWSAAGKACEPWGESTRAHCAAGADHKAPDEACTCGLRATEDLDQLLAAVTERNFAGSAAGILDDCGVIARVCLSGKCLPGVNIPDDDPPTTWRGSAGVVLDIHLAPGLEQHRVALEDRYNVAVKTYEPSDWPHAVAPLPLAAPRARRSSRYIDCCPAFLTPEDCAQLIDAARGHVHPLPGRRAEQGHSWTPTGMFPALEKMTRHVFDVNEARWNLDLDHARFAVLRYGPGQMMGRHTDLFHMTGRWRRVSASVQLSRPDDYEGGDLVFTDDPPTRGLVAPRDVGTAVTFTADQWHEVTEVTAGERWSLVVWVFGPSFTVERA